MSYDDLGGQLGMALDVVRNTAYERALAAVAAGAVVLDLGAGTCIFGLLAAKHGATRVYCVEPANVGMIGHEFARDNDLADRITVLQGQIEDLTLPEPVDVIVSAMTGNMLVIEDLLPAVFHARDRWLRPGGVLIPSRGAIDCVPVQAPELYDQHVSVWGKPHLGLDLSAAGRFAVNGMVFYDRTGLGAAKPLAPTTELVCMDMGTATSGSVDATVTFTADRDGRCDGILAWLRIELGTEWLSTGPFDEKVHWSAGFMPLGPPLVVQAGDQITVRLVRGAYEDWAWTVHAPGGARRGAAFLSQPMSPTRLRTAREDYKPVHSERARAMSLVIAAMDGTRTRAQLKSILDENFPRLFRAPGEAERFVDELVRGYGGVLHPASGEGQPERLIDTVSGIRRVVHDR